MSATHERYRNYLLAALPTQELAHLTPELDLVHLPLGLSIYEPATEIQYVYFPTSALVSLLYETEDGSQAEITVVGREGIVGIALYMGGETALSRAVVHGAGDAYRMNGLALKREFQRTGPLQQILMRYTLAQITECEQTLVCIRNHSLDQQFCCWLLRRFERLSDNDLHLSQETIATLLGVRRAAISEIAVKLRKAGLIEYERGSIALLDRPGLERRACVCYAAVRNEKERLLPKPIASLHDCPLVICTPNIMACNHPQQYCPSYEVA